MSASDPAVTSLPPAPPSPAVPPRDAARYSRWRVVTLVSVHLLAAAHIVHWRLAGKTLAPLELNEVMYTMELGIVTAGFLLMATAFLSAAVFGRFFCSWACHLLALQDLSGWLLGKFGIRAKPVRSRVLRVAPFVLLFYMFVWPQVVRLWHGEPLPRLHVQQTGEYWASFLTDDFWRNLPGAWIAGLTFLTCGFAIVYMLGSRGFCTAACPYGAVFALADRLAPVRIALRGNCTDCGRCTAVCQSGVIVHREVQRFGRVVDPACLKDLDCIAVCPEDALRVGVTRPSGLQSLARIGERPGHTWKRGEDVLAGVVMLATILVSRGLYDRVPLLMATGLGAVAAGLAVTTRRLLRAQHFGFRKMTLRRDGRLTATGWGYLAVTGAFATLWLHSAVVRWHEAVGARAFEQVRTAMAENDRTRGAEALQTAIASLELCDRWGLWNAPEHDRQLAALYTVAGRTGDATAHMIRVVASTPEDLDARLRLAFLHIVGGSHDDARAQLDWLDARQDLTAEQRQGVAAARDRLAKATAGGGEGR